MTARKKVALINPNDAHVFEQEPDLPSDLALIQALEQLGGVDNDAKVMVYKMDEKTQKRVYLFTCQPDEFIAGGLDQIRDQYGSGDYNIRVYGPEGLLKNQTVSIAAAIGRAQPQGDIVNTVRTMLTEQQNTLAIALNSGMQAIAQALQGAQSAKAPSLTELIAAVSGLNGLMPKTQASESPLLVMKQTLELMTQMRESMPLGDSEPDPLLSTFTRVIEPLISKAMSEPVLAQTPTPAQVTLQSDPIPETVPSSEESKMRALYRGFVAFLVSNASQNNPVETYAETVIDNAPEPMLRQFVDDPQWLDKLAGFNERVRLYPDWFSKLRDEVKKILTEMDKPVTTRKSKAATKLKPNAAAD